MNLHLAGKRALVTGGTKGIGLAIVRALLDEGGEVAFCAREPRLVEATAAELSEGRRRAIGATLDVRDGEAVRRWVTHSADELGGIDIVVSNVSAAAADWQLMYSTDVMGTVALVEAALPFLQKSPCGSIVAIASRAAYTGRGPYAAMKCALNSYIKGISDQLAPQGIRANVVSPGDIYFKEGYWHRVEQEDPALWAEAQVRNKMGRLGQPEEVARVVAFVASPAASFMSGANVRVDGAGSPSTQF